MALSHLRARLAAGLAVASITAALAACGSGASPPHGRGPNHGPDPGAGPVFNINDGGWQFRESFRVTAAPTFTTSDTGATVNAQPGQELVLVTVTFANPTGRPEPFDQYPRNTDAGGSNMPYPSSSFSLGVLGADAAKFGLSPGGNGDHPCQAPAGVRGYCDLNAQVVAAYPAGSPDGVGVPEIAAGGTATVTLAGFGTGITPGLPQGAPLNDVKLFNAGSTTPLN